MAVGKSDWQASRALRKRLIKGSAQASVGLFGLLVYGFADRLVMFLVLGSAFLVIGATDLVPAIIERQRGSQIAQRTRDNF